MSEISFSRLVLLSLRVDFESVQWMPYKLQMELLEKQCTSDDFLSKSNIASQNRVKGNATHTQDSVSFVVIGKRMETALKRKVLGSEIFIQTHKKSDVSGVVETIQAGKPIADIVLVDETATQIREI